MLFIILSYLAIITAACAWKGRAVPSAQQMSPALEPSVIYPLSSTP